MWKSLLISVCLIGCISIYGKAQDRDISRYAHLKMADIQTKTGENQTYEIIIKCQGYDLVDGTRTFADAAKGTYHVMGADSLIRWEGVTIAPIENIHHDFFVGEPLSFLDHFTYGFMSAPFANEDFHKTIPKGQVDWTMMLLTDAFMMHEYKLPVLDSLEFNRPYLPESMKNTDVVLMEGEFSFVSEYLQYLWDGFTTYNGKLCATVRFESFFNPVQTNWNKGRSMYYGEMFISLDGKQIEYARMVEDVVLQQKESKEKWMDMQRVVVLNKVE